MPLKKHRIIAQIISVNNPSVWVMDHGLVRTAWKIPRCGCHGVGPTLGLAGRLSGLYCRRSWMNRVKCLQPCCSKVYWVKLWSVFLVLFRIDHKLLASSIAAVSKHPARLGPSLQWCIKLVWTKFVTNPTQGHFIVLEGSSVDWGRLL